MKIERLPLPHLPPETEQLKPPHLLQIAQIEKVATSERAQFSSTNGKPTRAFTSTHVIDALRGSCVLSYWIWFQQQTVVFVLRCDHRYTRAICPFDVNQRRADMTQKKKYKVEDCSAAH